MKSLVYRIKGFMLPMAIFLLVILATLVGYAMRLAVLANMGAIQDVQGSQAYLAARAGTEWAAFQVLTPVNMATCPVVPSPFTINGFNIVLDCNFTDWTDKGTTQDIRIYNIVATASVGVAGSQDYVERRITVKLSRCRYNNPPGEECN
jgi:MSHA biogenesis protein MshP